MARKVKCQITKEWGTSDTFYKAPNDKYYKSQKLYEVWLKEKIDRAEFLDMFTSEFLGYKQGQVFPTVLCKRLQELEFYGFDVINQTVKKCRSSIEYALTHKDFANENGKISYIFTIIKNNINDVYKEHLRKEKTIEKQQIQTNNIDVTDEQSIMSIGSKQKAKDISSFLEDDEWI
jgi:hypothetical protein